MKKAVKNNYWEKFKTHAQKAWDFIYEKTNMLLGKVGFSVQGVFAVIILLLAGFLAIFVTLGIMSVLIFFIVFYILFMIIVSIFYKVFKDKK